MLQRTKDEVREIARNVLFDAARELAERNGRFDATQGYLRTGIETLVAEKLARVENTKAVMMDLERQHRIEELEQALSSLGYDSIERPALEAALVNLVLDDDGN